MNALFWFRCSEELAKRLGAFPMVRVPRPHLSFPVYEPVTTHHATIHTENGHYAWPQRLDRDRKFFSYEP